MRTTPALVVLFVVGALLVSGGSRVDSVQHHYLAESNELRTVYSYGTARDVSVRSLGKLSAIRARSRRPALARPLGANAPPWAQRMYGRSLLVLHGLTGRNGAVIAGARESWAYVWPRDAATAAIAFAAAGYRGEARRVAHFLLGLDLTAAARFHPDGLPVDGRAAQGDAAGWVAAAARAAGLRARPAPLPWEDRADYQEGVPGEYIGNAIASIAADDTRAPGEGRRASRQEEATQFGKLFTTPGGTLSRQAENPESGLDSAAAWAVEPFPQPQIFPEARRTLLRLAAESGRFGIVPSQDWNGGEDPWTAPTAWTAWSLAALAQRDRLRGADRERCPPPDGGAAARRDPDRPAPRARRRPHRRPDLDHAARLVPRLRDPRPAPALALNCINFYIPQRDKLMQFIRRGGANGRASNAGAGGDPPRPR